MGKVWGVDVGAKFIVMTDGKSSFKIEKPEQLKDKNIGLNSDDIVVLEQTGAYGVRWASIFHNFTDKVYFIDGRDFKNFRLSKTRKKNDSLDAFYIREFYITNPDKVRRYNFNQVYIRALIRQHIRNEKDLTKYINRLKQYLAVIFNSDDYFNLSRYNFLKKLDEIEEKLKMSANGLVPLALGELNKIKLCIEISEKLDNEILSIVKNHKDYELLQTFPIGDLMIATILAYSWDIDNFSSVDKFIGYVLMGATLEQSGVSVYRIKTDKSRTEIKGIFYNLFMQAHREKHILFALSGFVKGLVIRNYKKRYIKFLSRFLELVYYARKYRINFEEALKLKIVRLMDEEESLKKKELTERKAYKLFRIASTIETYKKVLMAHFQRKDISLASLGEQELLAYLNNELSEFKNRFFNPVEPEQMKKSEDKSDEKGEENMDLWLDLLAPAPEETEKLISDLKMGVIDDDDDDVFIGPEAPDWIRKKDIKIEDKPEEKKKKEKRKKKGGE